MLRTRRLNFLLSSMLSLPLLVACDDLSYNPQPKTDAGLNPETGVAVQCASPDPVVPCGAQYVLGDPGADIGGGGTVHSWAKIDSSGKALEFSFSIPIGVVDKLSGGGNDAGFYVKVPDVIAAQTVLKTFYLFYSAHGHVPVGVYDTKHFDFHFFVLPPDQVKGIDCSDRTPPPVDMPPDSWIVAPPPDNCTPNHGMPAINTQAPEFNKARFVTGLEITFYKGTFAAWEPKLTLETMQQRSATVSYTFPMMKSDPNHTMPTLPYPGTMQASYDRPNDAYIFTITGFAPWVR